MKYQLISLLIVAVFIQAKCDRSRIVKQDIKVLSATEQELITKNSTYNGSKQRIVGGSEAAPHSYPYQVALFITMPGQDDRVFCGGALLNEVFILTAAHCLQWNFMATEIEIILGAHNVYEEEPTQQRFNSKVYYVYKEWNPYTLENDIGIVRLPKQAQFTPEIQPIHLPKLSDQNKGFTFTPVTVSGWGTKSDDETAISPTLQEMESKVTLHLFCKLAFFGRPDSNQICIDGFRKSPCNGDSGSPVVVLNKNDEPVVQGIVSFGIGFGCEHGWPQVNTKVSKYLKWIYEKTGIPIEE